MFGIKGKLIWWLIIGVVFLILGLIIGLQFSIFDGIFTNIPSWVGWLGIGIGGIVLLTSSKSIKRNKNK